MPNKKLLIGGQETQYNLPTKLTEGIILCLCEDSVKFNKSKNELINQTLYIKYNSRIDKLFNKPIKSK